MACFATLEFSTRTVDLRFRADGERPSQAIKCSSPRRRETFAPPGNSTIRPPRSPNSSVSTAKTWTRSILRKSPRQFRSHWRSARRRSAEGDEASKSVRKDGQSFPPAPALSLVAIDNSKSRPAALSKAWLSSRSTSAVLAKASTIFGLNDCINGNNWVRTRIRANLSSLFISSARNSTPRLWQ